MKTLFLICSVIAFASCTKQDECNPGPEPSAPYGTADDVSRYEGSDGYRSIDYTYYCYGGKYVSVSYVRKDACSNFDKYSEYTSSGICGYPKIVNDLSSLSSREKIQYLTKLGYKFETRMFTPNPSPQSGTLVPS